MSGLKRRLAAAALAVLLAGGATSCAASTTGDHGYAICLALRAIAANQGVDHSFELRQIADALDKLADAAEDGFDGSTSTWSPSIYVPPALTTPPASSTQQLQRRYLPAEWCEARSADDVYAILGWDDDDDDAGGDR